MRATPALVICLALSACSTTHSAANKKLAVAFYDLAVNQHRPADAVAKYVGPKYVQHNPAAPDGGQTFVKFFEGYFANNPKAHADIKRVLADGDLVAIHAHWKRDENDCGRAVVDMFRVENGKIVEHWDVVQPVPEKAANSNTMF